MTEKVKNLIVRTATGIVFVAILVGGILWNWISFTLLFAVITALSVMEYCHIINNRADVKVNTLLNSVAGTYLFLAVSALCMEIANVVIFIPYIISVIYIFISELYQERTHALNNWAFSMLGQMYIALPFALLNLLAFQYTPEYNSISYSGILPLSVFILLWASDSGAYCFGSMFGKHRLFPSISPKKSWEGSIGGAITALAISQVLAWNFPFMSYLEWLGFGLVVVIFGTWGDLIESLMKRQLGIKDSGNILPGHGGMLDRFDSSLLAIPATVVYIYTLTLF